MTNNIEKEYLSKQIPYWNEQNLLLSFSTEELNNEIKKMEKIYEIERNKLLKKYKKRICKSDYKNGSKMDKYFIITFFNVFNGWMELNLYKNTLNKFKMFYKINHSIIYKWNSSYVPFDINSTKIKDVIWIYIPIPKNIRKNLNCMLHKDNSPSFKIYEKNNSRYCFWCNKWGNPANFIADIEWITYKEAFKKLINLYS